MSGAGFVGREMLGIDQRLGAGMDGLLDLPTDLVGGPAAHDRPKIGAALQRIAELVAVGEIDEALEKKLVDILMHEDALDAAAGLAGIEERAVDQILDRMSEIG